jgi:hypothetical protein
MVVSMPFKFLITSLKFRNKTLPSSFDIELPLEILLHFLDTCMLWVLEFSIQHIFSQFVIRKIL